jgi:hypothetical protein
MSAAIPIATTILITVVAVIAALRFSRRVVGFL